MTFADVEECNRCIFYVFTAVQLSGVNYCSVQILAGCIEEKVYYLNLTRVSGQYVVTHVDGPAQYHSLWGYPDRFPLRIFDNYEDLLKNTDNEDWSMRLQAVAALGRAYAGHGLMFGEDAHDDRKDAVTGLNRATAITQKIRENREAVKEVLEQKAATDPDDDVRRAAKAALEWNGQ